MLILLYAGAAALTIWLASRWIRPISLRDGAALMMLPLIEAGEALVRGQVLAPIDAAWRHDPLASLAGRYGLEPSSSGGLFDLWTQMLPWMAAVRSSWSAGEWPLWNPFVLCGEPLLGVYQPAPFHPLHLLGLALPLPQAFTLVVAGSLLLGGLSMFVLLRELALRPGPALAGAAIWCYSSFNLFWLGWPVVVAGAAAPLLVCGAVRTGAGGSGGQGLLAAGLAAVLLGGNPEIAALACAVAVAAFLARGVRRGDRWRWPARLRSLAAGIAIGAGLAAVQLLPFIDTLSQTSEFRSRAEHRPRSDPSWSTFLSRGLEQSLPPRLQVADPNSLPAYRFVYSSGWIGSLGLACALAGVALGRTRWRWFLAATALVGWAFAARAPGLSDALRALPPFGLVLPRYGAWLVVFGGAGLAAIGLDALGSRRARRLLGAACVLVALGLAAWLVVVAGRLDVDGSSGVRGQLGLAVVLPPILVLPLLRVIRSRNALAAAVLGLALVASQAELGGLHRGFDDRIFFPTFPSLAHLDRDSGPFRVAAVGRILQPNTATLWGLQDARGYDPMAFGRLVETFPIWASGPTRRGYYLWRLRPFLDYLNVRYVWSSQTPSDPEHWRCLECGGGLNLIRNERAIPRVFVPPAVVLGGSANERLAALAAAQRFDREVWIENPARPASGRPRPARNGPCRLTVRERGSGYEIESRCRRPAWAATSIPAWRGWRALGGREPIGLGYANHAFLALRLPAGESRLRLVYLPTSFVAGAAVSLAALFAALAGLVVRRRRLVR